MHSFMRVVVVWAVVCAMWGRPAAAQEDVAHVKATDLRAGGEERMRYFLIGPHEGTTAPKGGWKLLLVLPGGGGGEDFHPFLKRVYDRAVPRGWLAAQLVAPQWDDRQAQQLVWPTAKSPWSGMKFSTEAFIDAVVEDVKKKHEIDRRCVFTLSWSSGGPAAYAAALREKTPITGSFVAMSVFHPKKLLVEHAAGQAFYLYQSPQDKVCKLQFAKDARKSLKAEGATVKLVEYEGGHGWHGDVFGDIRTGLTWLEKNAGRSKESGRRASGAAKTGRRKSATKESPKKKVAASDKPGGGKNLVANGGFEEASEGWIILNNSGRADVGVVSSKPAAGKHCLKIEKSGGMPMDVVRYNIDDLPAGGTVTVSAKIRGRDVKNAFFKFFLYDAGESPLVEDVDVTRISGTQAWKTYSKTFDVPENATSAAVMIVMVMDGTLWVDEVAVKRDRGADD